MQAAQNGFNETGPALDLTNPQVVQDIIYGARSWVSTTSDQALPSSMANVDARTIYATASAAANMAAATAMAANATAIEITSYYTQSAVCPGLLLMAACQAWCACMCMLTAWRRHAADVHTGWVTCRCVPCRPWVTQLAHLKFSTVLET